MLDFVSGIWSVPVAFAVFGVAGVLTVVFSIRLVGLGDTLADRTGWGETFFGAVFFGLVTSLSGIVMTGVSAAAGQPELAYSNAAGGIAVQTLAIVAADLAYRRVNLEHAAASGQNLLFGTLLIVLLSTALLGSFSPEVTVLGVHPVSVVMVALYLGGLRLIRAQEEPMWRAVTTKDTREDQAEEQDEFGNRTGVSLGLEFTAIAGIGLLIRQRRGWWRLGLDGILLAAIYASAVLTLAF